MRTDKQGAFPRGHMQRNMQQLCCDGSHIICCVLQIWGSRHKYHLAHCSFFTVLSLGGCIDRSGGDVNVAAEGLLVNMHESLGKRLWVRWTVARPGRQVAFVLWSLSELWCVRQCPHGLDEAVIHEHEGAPEGATPHIQSSCLTTRLWVVSKQT